MIFSLEALHAKYGDSLLLRYGDPAEPRLVMIDGGPRGTYKRALKPRLEELREAAGGTLTIDVLMVSHIDSDHIKGVLDFSQDLIDNPPLRSGYLVSNLWHNSFEDIVASAGEGAGGAAIPSSMEAVIASVNEGRQLHNNAAGLHWPQNEGFAGFVMAPGDKGVPVDLDPLKLTVIGPRQAELDALREEWAKEIAKLQKEGKLTPAEAGEPVDTRAPNLSSITCVAELGEKTMLLTGDALGEKVLAELETAGFLPAEGTMEVDLLKVPHHGSSYNNPPKLFSRVRSPRIVISANGKDDNPDLPTLERLSAARPDDDFTIYLTETDFVDGVGDTIRDFFAREKAAGRKYEVVFTPEDELLRLDLLDPLD
ncbi:MAG TPA: MBL fold metallo-hydrolase [Solirubrobacterales bacterium]|nr:MBL fold metallo-hydrolase [Solirubrobacterales bacterium]